MRRYWIYLQLLAACQLVLLSLCQGINTKMAAAAVQGLLTPFHLFVSSESREKANDVTRTTGDYLHVRASRSSYLRGWKSQKKTPNTENASNRKKQLRMLDLPDEACLRWSPQNLNITPDSKTHSLLVDYCQNNDFPVPDTSLCLWNETVLIGCAHSEKPTVCSHTFENLKPGNFTIRVKALCKKCFDKIVYNKRCSTPLFIKYITFEEPTFEKEHVTSKIKHKFSSNNDSNVIPITVASCSAIFVFGVIFLMTCVVKKCRTGSTSTGGSTTADQVSLPSTTETPFMIIKNKKHINCGQKHGRFRHTEEPIEHNVLLTGVEIQGQEQIHSICKSYPRPHSIITETEPVFIPDIPPKNLQRRVSSSDSLQTCKSQEDEHDNSLPVASETPTMNRGGTPTRMNPTSPPLREILAMNIPYSPTRMEPLPPHVRPIIDIPYHLILDPEELRSSPYVHN